MPLINVLMDNFEKIQTPELWAKALKVRIIDADGFAGRTQDGKALWTIPMGMVEFLKRTKQCTIQPII